MSGGPPTPRVELAARLDAVEARLRAHASAEPATGLTDPDEPSGERWDWGQVWAHLAEFIPYWIGEVGHVLSRGAEEIPPFGRTKTDPERIAAIERDRHRSPDELMTMVSGHVAQLRALIRGMTAEDWSRSGVHPTLGEMSMPKIFDEFLVGHLEAHADQLDGLAKGATSA